MNNWRYESVSPYYLRVYLDGKPYKLLSESNARQTLDGVERLDGLGNPLPNDDIPAHVLAEGIDWMLEHGYWH